MQLRKTFARTRFSSSVVSRALESLKELATEDAARAAARAEADFKAAQSRAKTSGISTGQVSSHTMVTTSVDLSPKLRTSRDNGAWSFDSMDEWYAAYERGASGAFRAM